jgi:branched-chain amino acid transport system ATP-binding protein
MRVRENVQVALAARARRLGALFGNLDAAAEADALLEQADIRPLADALCAELAYGDLKRVELAIALAVRPRLLLMDEPTAGMAAEERRALMALVKGIARTGVAVLFTEHDMDAVFGHADRVIVLSEGSLIASGPPEAVRADPLVRAVYLGEDAHA